MTWSNKLFILAIFLMLTSISFLFRDQIPNILYFGKSAPQSQSSSVGQKKVESVVANQTSEAFVELPLYVGRPIDEVKPSAEGVKLFNEDQKNKLYSSIRAEALGLKNNPDSLDGWIRIGILKKTIGDFDGARDAWEYASITRPLNSLSFANLGELYWQYLKDFRKAEENFKASIKNKADDVSNYVSLADLYHYSFKEKYDLADDVLLEGLEKNPGDETLMRHLAFIYGEQGSIAESLKLWKKVLEKTPEDKSVIETIKNLQQTTR